MSLTPALRFEFLELVLLQASPIHLDEDLVKMLDIFRGRHPHEEEYTYILVIEGKNGSREAKVMVRGTRQDIADVMMHEALNGYSTVFSGVILRRNYENVFGNEAGTWEFKQVNTFGEAIAVESKDEMTIGVIC